MTRTAAPRAYRMVARAEQVARTRHALLNAARDRFLRLPYDEVSVRDVAADAGVTPQTLHAHFRTKDDLLEAAATTCVDAVSEQLLAERGRPRTARGLARSVVAQYEHTGDANLRLLALGERSAAVGALLQHGRREHLTWLVDCLGDRLPHAGPGRQRALDALYAATDVGIWKLLRRDLGRSRAETVATVALLVAAVVDGGAADATGPEQIVEESAVRRSP